MTNPTPQTLPDDQIDKLVREHLGGLRPGSMLLYRNLIRAALAAQPLAVAAIPEGSWVNLGVTLPEPLLQFDDWLNAPPSREVQEPSEAHAYRFDAYRRWERAVKELRALALPQPPAGQQDRGEATAAQGALPPGRGMVPMTDWQPIETAPTDLILLSCVGWAPSEARGEPWPVKVGGYWDGSWHIFGASWKPTHWMPLPAAPSPAAPGNGEGGK